MDLKTYQSETLRVLRRFLEQARVEGASAAYEAIVAEPTMARRLKGFAGSYKALNGLDETPYVCLRLPTGGGKTILAAHAVNIAKEAWIERDFPLVLWLVPTTTIRKQTVDALKNPRHPYRAALDDAFAGRVRVFDIGDFTQLLPHDLRSNCCIVVATIQTLRVKDTEGRKVYAHHEMLEPHFTGVPGRIPGLEVIETGNGAGTIKFSFANLMHLHRPLMIVDEAHKAVTGLSREMQTRVNPTAIIEFTATPLPNSNILHSVSAQELKDEEMIKLPVMLSEHQTWQAAVSGAIAKRAELVEDASRERDYIRPIVLFQAQNKDEEVTVAVLKQHLIDVENIDPNRIAVATGDQRELDGIDLFDPDCKIDFIITVEALKEGWDCSFAYVFCSAANIHNATDAEQLLGRVLRMPYAKKRSILSLNRAYANLTSRSFSEAAYALKDRLVAMGFEESEAEDNILPEQLDLHDGLFGHPGRRPQPSVTVSLDADPTAVKGLEAAVPTKVRVTTWADGKAMVKITGFLSPAEKEKLIAALPNDEVSGFNDQVAAYEAKHLHHASPAEKGETFTAPALMAWVQGELQLADIDVLMEYHDWSLTDHSAKLEAKDFSIQESADTFEIDIDQQRLFVKHSDQSAQLLLDIAVEGWSEQTLVLFLDRQVRDKSIGQGELVRWLTELVNYLTGPRNIPLSALMQCKYPLARKVKERIAEIRRKEREGIYQHSLFAPEAKPEISFHNGFVFAGDIFAGARTYRGAYRFSKHFTGWDQVAAFDGADDGEELGCAKILDSLIEVKHWLRNVPRHPDAFWLPTASGRFYPDFIAELNDGRIFVVEYKGAHLTDAADTDEKRAIGALWEKASTGKGLFLMVEKLINGKDMRSQIRSKLL